MKSFRLSPLMVFLIILATLLIGYVLIHLWKNYQSTITEGFATEDGIPLAGYSTTETKVVPIVADLLYFDSVNKALVNKPAGENMLYIKTKSGTDMSFNVGAGGGYTVVDAGFGDISYNNAGATPTRTVITSVTTVGAAKTYFSTLSGESIIYMDVDLSNGGLATAPADTTIITSARTYSDSIQKVAATNAAYPALKINTDTSNGKRRFYRQLNSFNVANLVTGDAVKYTFTTTPDNRYAVVHIPVATTSVSFLHVIDLTYKQHVDTFYFNSATAEVASIRLGKDIFDKTVKTIPASLSEVNGTSVTPLTMSTSNDVDFDVALKYDETSKTVHVMGSKKETVGRTQFYAILSFSSNTNITINFSSTTIGTTSNTPTNDVTISGDTLTGHSDLYKTLEKMKLLKDFFSSPDNDYLLKTEVVPPVCPSCPSCPAGGVCNTCGGNGGSGTATGTTGTAKDDITSNELAKDFGTGATNLLRDGAKGTTDLIRDGAGGVTNIAKESASGVGNFAKDIAGGAALGTAVAVGGVYGMGRDAVGGAYNAATDAVTGTVGLGREIITGTTGMLNGYGQGRGQQGQGQGPNTSMGGYQNSYGGQNSYQPPSTVGQDPYSYFGAVPPKAGSCSNYMPRTADFSHFGR